MADGLPPSTSHDPPLFQNTPGLGTEPSQPSGVAPIAVDPKAPAPAPLPLVAAIMATHSDPDPVPPEVNMHRARSRSRDR